MGFTENDIDNLSTHLPTAKLFSNMATIASWQNSTDSSNPPKYRSQQQSPRPGQGGKRFFPNQPPTPDQTSRKRVWVDKLGTSSTLADGSVVTQGGAPIVKSRRASFLKFLNDHPTVAARRQERQLADGTRQTTIRRNGDNTAFTSTTTTTTTSSSTNYENVDTTEQSLSSGTDYDLNTATRLFQAMDTDSNGRIDWSEFLSYLNQSEGRTPPMQSSSRRSSLGMGLNATTKVQRRLALRKFFNRLDVDMDGTVSLNELKDGIESNQNIKRMFDSTALLHLGEY